jgi:hypothetical protein
MFVRGIDKKTRYLFLVKIINIRLSERPLYGRFAAADGYAVLPFSL